MKTGFNRKRASMCSIATVIFFVVLNYLKYVINMYIFFSRLVQSFLCIYTRRKTIEGGHTILECPKHVFTKKKKIDFEGNVL